jgi:hypothetical protein
MPSLASLLSFTHLVGLALGVGSATVKLTLLLKSKRDQAFLPVFVAADKPITRLIILGLVLLTLSGIGWLLIGYSFTPLLVVKLALVGVIWVIGPVIDNVVRPKFQKLAPESSESASPAFVQIQQRYVALETIATGLFYVVIVIWILL